MEGVRGSIPLPPTIPAARQLVRLPLLVAAARLRDRQASVAERQIAAPRQKPKDKRRRRFDRSSARIDPRNAPPRLAPARSPPGVATTRDVPYAAPLRRLLHSL
jgi:hypothetical protein